MNATPVSVKVRALLNRLDGVSHALASEPETFRQLHLLRVRAKLQAQLGRLRKEAAR